MKKDDSLQSLRIHVEGHHIESAQRKNSHHCMIADAIKDALPEAKYLRIDLQSIRFTIFDETRYREEGIGVRYQYFTPTIAQHAILKFDQGIKVREFEFTARTGIKRNVPWPHTKKQEKVKRSHANKGIKKHIVKKEREFGICMFEEINGKPIVHKPLPPERPEPTYRKLISSIRPNVSRAI